MTDFYEAEFAIRSQLTWKRDGDNWVLWHRRRRRKVARVVPDATYPGMYRSVRSDGRLSDMANLTWSKGVALDAAIRELSA
jgi:hypothetical protein